MSSDDEDFIEGALDDSIPQTMRRLFLLVHQDLAKLSNAATSMAASVQSLNAKVDVLDARAAESVVTARRLEQLEASLEKREANETWLRRAVISALIGAFMAIAIALIKDGIKIG